MIGDTGNTGLWVCGNWWIWASIFCVCLLGLGSTLVVGKSEMFRDGSMAKVFGLVNFCRTGESWGSAVIIPASWGTGLGPQETFLTLNREGVEVFESARACLGSLV